ncbi:RING-type E3 ubiquitin transferase [Trifolium repens]|nr:RING-type E3 ubiquitin transferase [Trifolium repens]
MMQCCICEDWFHETHIGDEIPKDDEGEPLFEDFMCKACSEKLCFLKLYPDEILATRKKAEVSKDKLVLEDKPCESNKPIGETSSSSSAKLDSWTLNQCPKSSDMHVSCLLGVNLLDGIHDKPLFLAKNWRDALCKCNNCLEFYNKKQIAFLLDKEDSAVAYEKMAKQKREEKLLQQQEGDSLEILKGVEDAIGQMKVEIRTFRESAEASKPITVDDVYQFFKKLENKRCTFQESESTDSSKPDCKRPRLQ